MMLRSDEEPKPRDGPTTMVYGLVRGSAAGEAKKLSLAGQIHDLKTKLHERLQSSLELEIDACGENGQRLTATALAELQADYCSAKYDVVAVDHLTRLGRRGEVAECIALRVKQGTRTIGLSDGIDVPLGES